ncbi:queD like 2 [Pseudoalteromonas luteoviolacea]|uniref:VC2046/SO_2500 family protein n=1 Tax=Pseudoalteromonas luteoviolacea TaxID=43657 RepID=UPI001B38A8A0|nr:VC2046/SO_2500 family protein [Pseudoalteromonas luteoviolacea]MBQ4814124.1 queD like 2 [Pseudoalteromonas luteoviolacea]
MQIEQLLLKEAQLGIALNLSVHESRRGDFALLLSALSQDALDFSQFDFPRSAVDEQDKSEDALKKELQIGPKKPLAPAEYDFLIGQYNRYFVKDGGLEDIKLNECLDPEPLHIRDNKLHVPLSVVENLEPAVRAKLIKQQNPEIKLQEREMDAAGFYDQLASGEMQSQLRVAV